MDPPTTPPRHNPSDEERDTFEDAPEVTPKANRTRSLTERRPSSSIKRNELALETMDENHDKENSSPTQSGAVERIISAQKNDTLEGLDEVNLDSRGISPTRASIHSTSSNKDSGPKVSRTSSTASVITSPDRTPTTATMASNMAGRFKSPFSWLSRNPTSNDKKLPTATSPAFDRHSDADSSLKDRFKAVRMREEAGITSPVDDEHKQLQSLEHENDTGDLPPTMDRKVSSSSVSQTVNPNLPPGTAVGLVEGPRESNEQVDWDLWQAVVSEGPAAVSRTSPAELNKAIAAGIPQAIRGVIWQVLANSKNEQMESFYHDLVARGTNKERLANGHGDTNGNKEKDSIASSASSIHSERSGQNGSPTSPSVSVEGFTNPQAPKPKGPKEELAHIQVLEKTIKRDLGARTSYSKFLMSSGLQDGLFGICKAYALYDEEVGYAQGMNFIAMPLLFNMREEEAFCMFVKLMSKYGLRDMFTHDMPGLHLHLYQFERLLEDIEPALYCHLNRRGVTPHLYATQWFLTLFAYRFPLQLVQRIYDLILSSNISHSILKFALVLMQKNKDTLLAMQDMSQISQFLKEKLFDVYIDKAPSSSSILESGFFGSTGGVDKEVYRADDLVHDACAVNIPEDLLKTYTTEWEDRTRAERERETELETLRAQVGSLSTKVRRLEERVEKSDSEHVQMASELVRTKVANTELTDENESLKMRVEELTKVVAAQTEEVEQRLRGEMDEVMKRNSEVHNANRALEEEKSEMERILVETKMQYAQVNDDHESLKQKWNTIAQMMSK